MGSPDRIQLDDHFAAAKRRSSAPPPRTIGPARAIGLLLLLAGGIAATWWWALQPASSSPVLTGPAPLTTIADRQAAVAAGDADEPRGPRLGGETHEQYQARLARLRARDEQAAAQSPAAAVDAQHQVEGDRALAGRVAPAAGLPAAGSTRAATVAPAALVPPDSSALGLARRVNDRRDERAVHLRWLDACQKQHLVDVARARIAQAAGGDAAHAAQVAAQNLAADIDTHQREAQRIDGLLGTAEQRLVDYCASHGQQVPPLDSPAETVSGVAAQPRPMPVATTTATIRPTAAAAQSRTNLDPFTQPGR